MAYAINTKDGSRWAKILDLLRQGISYNAIVAEVGCSKFPVNYYAKQNGTAKKLRIYDWKVIQTYHD